MASNSPDLVKDINLYTQEAQQSQKRLNSKKTMPKHILKLLRTKDKKNWKQLPMYKTTRPH